MLNYIQFSDTKLYNSYHHTSPEFFTFLNWNSVPVKHWLPISIPFPHLPAPGIYQCTFWLYEFDYSRYLVGEGNGNPLQYSCLENLMDGGAWKAAVHGITDGRTWLSDFTFTFHFHALEKEMATHSSVLAWRIPGTGEPGGLPSMGSHRVGHDWSDLTAGILYKRNQTVFVKWFL